MILPWFTAFQITTAGTLFEYFILGHTNFAISVIIFPVLGAFILTILLPIYTMVSLYFTTKRGKLALPQTIKNRISAIHIICMYISVVWGMLFLSIPRYFNYLTINPVYQILFLITLILIPASQFLYLSVLRNINKEKTVSDLNLREYSL